MGKRKTHEEYVADAEAKNPHIMVLGIYDGASTPILHKCKYCGKKIDDGLNKCPKCNGDLVLYKEIKPNKGPPKLKNKDIFVKLHS